MPTIRSVSISPNPVDTGAVMLLAVDADFTLDYIGLNGRTWNALAAASWDEMDSGGIFDWEVKTGITATGNSIKKTGGIANSWDAPATSRLAVPSGNFYLEWTLGAANLRYMLGLNNGAGGSSYTDIAYCFYLDISNTLGVYENNVYRGNVSTYLAGDTLRIAVEAGKVKYYKNGTLVYTSSVAPTYPLKVDSSFYTLNAEALDVRVYRT